MSKPSLDPALAYTSPENRGICCFCGKEEGGYAKRGTNGQWWAACWSCVKPAQANALQPKRKQIGTIFMEDGVTAGDDAPVAPKAKGMAPSTYRPKVN
jgi:hypothetical protein